MNIFLKIAKRYNRDIKGFDKVVRYLGNLLTPLHSNRQKKTKLQNYTFKNII